MLLDSFKLFFQQKMELLAEGGNIFPGRRILKQEVLPTLKKIEEITGLNVINNTLGSTGKKESSGDIDIVVDSKQHSKQDLIDILLSNGVSSPDIKKSGIQVHYKAPIYDQQGNQTKDFIQTDFMFHEDPVYLKFFYDNNEPENSPYKGSFRNITLSSIASSKELTLSMNGLMEKATKKIITRDPNIIAKRVLGEDASIEDLFNLESVMSYLKSHYKQEEVKQMVAAAEQTLQISLI